MKANLESVELVLRLWRQVYQTYTLLKRCEDQVFGEYGLTTEQGAVLGAIDYFGGSMKVTDIAHWLERSTNSISMIVDRMVKAGLVRRTRSKGDRREVRVANTSKGQAAIKPAHLASLKAVDKILSSLSHEEKITLLNLLGTVKYEVLKCVEPGVDIEKVKKNEVKQAANLTKWLSEHGLTATPEAKRQGGKKRKTARRV